MNVIELMHELLDMVDKGRGLVPVAFIDVGHDAFDVTEVAWSEEAGTVLLRAHDLEEPK